MVELSELFNQLNEQVVFQEAQVVQAEEQTTQVNKDGERTA
jgi:syntaxin 1B/2/3